jgi:myo-inositol-1(or 4)-monophosphatase
MTAAALKAGRAIVRDFGEIGQLQVSRKGTSDFATASDKRSEKILYQELLKARPTCGFMMEESGEIAGSDPTHRFVIDPIDGTHNFIHAIPYFCISIAYEKQIRDGRFETQAGVIFDPLRNELFCAELYQGATLDDKRLMVSGRSEPDTCMVATFNPPADHTSYKARIHAAIRQKPYSLRSCGATALDLAYVAAGRFEAACHVKYKHWDVAAGALLIREAGGGVFERLDAEKPLFLAGNQHIHEKMVSVISAV